MPSFIGRDEVRHPAIVAQAAATVAAMMPGRFTLGVGSGENLNEHVLGDRWPPPPVRLEMLEEAIEVMRGLWEGDTFSHRGRHYTVEGARVFTLPPDPPRAYADAGFDHVCFHQIGPDQDAFFGFWESELRPRLN